MESNFVKIAVWKLDNGQITILKIVKEEFSGSQDDLIETSDRAISKASFGIKEEDVNKIIFAVPSSWSVDGKIQSNYLKILKNICVSLSLRPVGFVITSEAIVKVMENSDNVKINFLLFHIGPEILNLSHVEHGALTENVSSLRSEEGHIVDDFLELVSRFKTTSLPNKIIIFDGNENLDDIKQQIIKSPITQKEKRFLHFPSIEVLGENADMTAVIYSVASQMGYKIVEEQKTTGFTDDSSDKPTEEINNQKNISEIKIPEKETNQNLEQEVTPEIVDQIPEESKTFVPILPNKKEVENLGFFHERDVDGGVDDEKTNKNKSSNKFGEIIQQKFQHFNLSPKKAIITIVIMIVFFIIAIVLFWLIFAKSTVILRVKTKKFNDNVVFLLTENGGKNNKSISAKRITASVKGEMEAQATGKKKTGDKAKGEVVIFNKNTDSEKVFPKGTIITDGTLRFITDQEVTIASASVKIDAGSETKIFGKSTVSVTAEKFGNEYNISDNRDWSVDNYSQSSFLAHNEREFSGGTTKEIQVVSSGDQSKLLNKLKKKLETQAFSQILKKINVEKEDYVKDFTSADIKEKIFSDDVDDEAKTFNLSMQINFSTYSFLKADARKHLEYLLKGKIPEDYFINQNTLVFKYKDVEKNDKGYNLNFSYEATAIPKINQMDIASKINNRPISILDKYLLSDSVTSYDIKVWPTIPFFPKLMPSNPKNITVKLEY